MADLPTQKKLHMGLDDICKQRNAKKEQPARARPQVGIPAYRPDLMEFGSHADILSGEL